MSAELADYRINGHYEHDGMVYAGEFTPPGTLDKFKDLNLEDFILIATYPKNGTTWTQELSWLLLTNGDFEGASQSPVYDRVPFIDIPHYMDNLAATNPKVLKTHLQPKFFVEQFRRGLKVLLIMRNPKDALVSYFHFYRGFNSYHFPGTWDDFFEMFKKKRLAYGDYFDFYSAWLNLKTTFGKNIILVKYEDMIEDSVKEIDRIAHFIDKTQPEELIKRIAQHCSFKNMKENKMTNYTTWKELMNDKMAPFMRKGKVGDWTNYLSEDQSTYIDGLCKERFGEYDINFDFE